MGGRVASRGPTQRADLDGLRGLAIGLVLIEHTALTKTGYLLPFTPAMAGVTTFFVLSGYLITTLLLREPAIDLRNFYLRRVIRLGPALAVLVGAVAVLGMVGALSVPWLAGALSSAFYVTNWAAAMGVDAGLLGHTWSLAIEEQFYLAWPIAMILVPRRWLLSVAGTFAIAGCAMYALEIGPFFHSTLTNGGAILAGAAMAMIGGHAARLAGLLGVALIMIGAIFWVQAWAVVGAALVIKASIGALTPIAAVGRRAYSLYLWSWPLVLLMDGPLALPMTVGLAELSYRFVERPIRDRYHARLAPRGLSRAARTRAPLDRTDRRGRSGWSAASAPEHEARSD